MQLLISAIVTLALGAGAFLGLGQHSNTLVESAHSQIEGNVEAQVEVSPTPTPTATPVPTVSPTPSASPSVSLTTPTPTPGNNGLHLGITRGNHFGEGKEELHESEEAELHENEHSNPTSTPTTTSIGIHVEEE